jgi:anaerobic nitric oxide reductase flavorubredoxin
MAAIEIKPDVYWIGVNDRTSDLFEGLWPITQEGISYNAYFINDEKKGIIDLTKSFKADEFFAQVNEITDISQLDYIIINHMEPDHTGIVNIVRRIAPGATILGTEKTVEMLKQFFGITEKVEAVKDGQTLSLGKRQLQFFYPLCPLAGDDDDLRDLPWDPLFLRRLRRIRRVAGRHLRRSVQGF